MTEVLRLADIAESLVIDAHKTVTELAFRQVVARAITACRTSHGMMHERRYKEKIGVVGHGTMRHTL